MDIPKLLKAARAAAELSQPALARILDVDRVSIARWEAGTYTPSLADLERLAKATGFRLKIDFEKIRK
jgi:transcriptional regulator with XRE-family HTH domain